MGRRKGANPASTRGSRRRPDARWAVGLAAVVLVVLACHTFGPVAGGAGVAADSDALFHAWRVTRTIEGGSLLPPSFEAFENFPRGGHAVWPPLHDASLALLARLGGSTPADPRKGLVAASAFPVIGLLLSLFAAAWIASKRGGREGAALAAVCLASTPVLLRRSAFGEVDHNVSEVLFGLLLAAVAFVPWDGVAVRKPLVYGCLWAVTLLFGLGFFPGIVVAAALVSLGVVLGDLRDGGRRAGAISAGFLAAAVSLSGLASLRFEPDPGDPWRLGPVYVLVLASGAVAMGAMSLFARRGDFRARVDWVPAASLVGGAALWFLAPAPARQGLFEGLLFVGAREPWLGTIEEFQPVLYRLDLLRLSLPALAVALVAVGGAAAARILDRRDLVLLVPLAGYLGLGLAQRRFLAPALAFSAVGAGIVFGRIPPAARKATLLTLALSALVITPVFRDFLSMYAWGIRPRPPQPGDVAAEMIARSTPEPDRKPTWGVLAPWTFGHEILFGSGRPVAVNNFGSFHPGFDRAMRILIEPSPARALEELRALGIRYVLTARAPLHVPTTAAAIGDDPERFYDDLAPDSLLGLGAVRRPGFQSLLHRLHEQDGRPLTGDRPSDRAALSHFVLVDESAQTYPAYDGRRVPFLRLWEVR